MFQDDVSKPRALYGCGNKNIEVLCRSLHCHDCDNIREKRKYAERRFDEVGLPMPHAWEYPPMPEVKPPKINGMGITHDPALSDLGMLNTPMNVSERNPPVSNELAEFKIWFAAFCDFLEGKPPTLTQWGIIQNKIKDIFGK